MFLLTPAKKARTSTKSALMCTSFPIWRSCVNMMLGVIYHAYACKTYHVYTLDLFLISINEQKSSASIQPSRAKPGGDPELCAGESCRQRKVRKTQISFIWIHINVDGRYCVKQGMLRFSRLSMKAVCKHHIMTTFERWCWSLDPYVELQNRRIARPDPYWRVGG